MDVVLKINIKDEEELPDGFKNKGTTLKEIPGIKGQHVQRHEGVGKTALVKWVTTRLELLY